MTYFLYWKGIQQCHEVNPRCPVCSTEQLNMVVNSQKEERIFWKKGSEQVEFPVSDVWPDTVNIIKNL